MSNYTSNWSGFVKINQLDASNIQNLFWIFDESSWLFYMKLITMHGHLKIRYIWSGMSSDKLDFVGRVGEFALKTLTWVQF